MIKPGERERAEVIYGSPIHYVNDFCEVDELIAIINKIKKENEGKYNKIYFALEGPYCDGTENIFYGVRDENEDEKKFRLKEEGELNKRIEKNQRKQYEALKKKFEK